MSYTVGVTDGASTVARSNEVADASGRMNLHPAFLRGALALAIATLASCSTSNGSVPDGRVETIDAKRSIDASLVFDGTVLETDAPEQSPDARINHPSDATSTMDAMSTSADSRSTAPDAATIVAICGNGVTEAGEQCDDGNLNNFDACSNACVAAGDITLVSLDSIGNLPNSGSMDETTTADGHLVVFTSYSTNLADGIGSGEAEIFVHDRTTYTTQLVSVDSSGNVGNGISQRASVSADGRYIAFDSTSDNLVAGDSNQNTDVFLRDTVAHTTVRISVDSDGNQSAGGSYEPSISANGRFIAFWASDDDLASNDTNGRYDVYVHDMLDGSTTLVSANADGTPGELDSLNASISADGRYIAYYSDSPNLVTPNIVNGFYNIFVYDMVSGTTALASCDSNGNQGDASVPNLNMTPPAINADGRYVAFWSAADNLVAGDTNGIADLFLHDFTTGITSLVSVDSAGEQADVFDGAQNGQSISDDGRFISFSSTANNLVDGDTNQQADIFVHDEATGTTTRVDVSANGAQGDGFSYVSHVSADGSVVAFNSYSDNLVPGELPQSFNSLVFVTSGFPHAGIVARANGRNTSEGGGSVDITVALGEAPQHDVTVAFDVSDPSEGALSKTSLTFTPDNWQSPQIVTVTGVQDTLADGDIAYTVDFTASTSADSIYNGLTAPSISLINLDDDLTRLVSQSSAGIADNSLSANGDVASISNGGRFVAFSSPATNLVPDDRNGFQDVFVRDTALGLTSIISTDSLGVQGNGASSSPSISADGRYVAFASAASNLVDGDTNDAADIFVYDRQSGTVELVSVNSDGVIGNGSSSQPSISDDGQTISFTSSATNLSDNGDSNGFDDIFVHDMTTGSTTRVSIDSNGQEANSENEGSSISANGQFVAFSSFASNLAQNDTNNRYDVFLRDLVSNTTTIVSVDSAGDPDINGASAFRPGISANGQFVVFVADPNFATDDHSNGQLSIFVRDTIGQTTTRVDVDSQRQPGNSGCDFSVGISRDGTLVAFSSNSSNLVIGDSNAQADVFIRDMTSNATTLVGRGLLGAEGNGGAGVVDLSPDGTFVTFTSTAKNLVNQPLSQKADLYVAPVVVSP